MCCASHGSKPPRSRYLPPARWCGARAYPHVSPSMIVLAVYGDRCLLGRRVRAPEHRYSCLAGYIEPGESIEDAVVREVFEEAGVRLGAVRYHSSQPWPFPATLM